MGDFDTSVDYQLAGAILFPLALVGLSCNLSVVVFLKSMPSLSNSFGSLTLSQAIVDSIHQMLFAFYFAPTIFFQSSSMYAVSDHFGYFILTAYQIYCYSHLCISANRFAAVCMPLTYVQESVQILAGTMQIFSKKRTQKIIVGYWILGITHMTNMLKYADFLLNSLFVVIVAILDVSSVARLHCMNVKNTDAMSMQRRQAQKNLVYQAALQGVCFISELLTYFLFSRMATNKWQAFALTSISWCLVNGMDGLIVLVCNHDFRMQEKKMMGYQEPMTNFESTTVTASEQGLTMSNFGSSTVTASNQSLTVSSGIL